MKKLLYILIILTLVLGVAMAQSEEKDTLDIEKAAKAEAAAAEAVEMDAKPVTPKPTEESKQFNIGEFLQGLFSSESEEVKASKEASTDYYQNSDSYRSTTPAPSSEGSSYPSAGSYGSYPTTSKGSSTSSSWDIFIDKNKNGIDDRRESTGSTESKRSR